MLRAIQAFVLGVTLTVSPHASVTAPDTSNGGLADCDESSEDYVWVAGQITCVIRHKSTTPSRNGDESAASDEASNSTNRSATSSPSLGPVEGDCRFSILTPQPGPTDPRWEGNDPAKGVLLSKSCFTRLARPAGVPDGVAWTSAGYAYAAAGQAPRALPPVDPTVLAQNAVKEMTMPSPALHYGPFPNRVAVKVPVWLWVDDPGPQTLTVSAGTVSVTATATITSTTWSMGDSTTNPDTAVTPGPAFTCQGLGSAPGADPSGSAPPCGYTYVWRSTAGRTRGTCTWPVTVTANWTVNWQATTGQNGTLNARTTTATTVHVGEWRTVLVNDAGSQLPDTTDPACPA